MIRIGKTLDVTAVSLRNLADVCSPESTNAPTAALHLHFPGLPDNCRPSHRPTPVYRRQKHLRRSTLSALELPPSSVSSRSCGSFQCAIVYPGRSLCSSHEVIPASLSHHATHRGKPEISVGRPIKHQKMRDGRPNKCDVRSCARIVFPAAGMSVGGDGGSRVLLLIWGLLDLVPCFS